MEYTINRNANFNSLEIAFDGIPSAAVRAAIRELKYRWNATKKLWYGFADEETTREAIDNADKTDAPAKPETVAKVSKPRAASLWERTRTDKIPAYGTENEIKAAINELARAKNWGYDRAAAAYFREHLKKQFPEVKFSITSGGAGWLNKCSIRIIASPYARIFVKGNPDAAKWFDQCDHYENGEQLEAIYQYCKKLFNAADADDGDYYADYGAHHDLYGDVTVSGEYKQTEATDEQNSDAADFSRRAAEQKEKDEAARRAEWEEREKQRKIDAENAEKEAAETEKKIDAIEKHVEIVELAEDAAIMIDGLKTGIGKESDIAEVLESIDERENDKTESARITRKVIFTDEAIFNDFCGLFLCDFSFLAGMGGTATSDERVTNDHFFKLNREQRESVEFYMNNCVAVYLGDVLQFVIDPEGFDYARYVCIPSEASAVEAFGDYEAKQTEGESLRAPFYFPETIEKQIESANLKQGEPVTVLYYSDFCMVSDYRGTLESLYPRTYAQYSDAARLCMTIDGKRKATEFIIKSGNAVIYRGILPPIPQRLKCDIVRRENGMISYFARNVGSPAREYMRNVIDFYAEKGFTPAIDTIQR